MESAGHVDWTNRPPLVAAGVNAAIIVLLPGLLAFVLETLQSIYPSLASNTVHARQVSPIMRAVETSVVAIFVTSPLAAVAAWRTWVHATRWQMHRRTWWGVLEAAAVGALCVIVMLLPGVLTAAVAGAGSIAGIGAFGFYAAIGGLVGLAFGLVLQLTAIAVLKLASLL